MRKILRPDAAWPIWERRDEEHVFLLRDYAAQAPHTLRLHRTFGPMFLDHRATAEELRVMGRLRGDGGHCCELLGAALGGRRPGLELTFRYPMDGSHFFAILKRENTTRKFLLYCAPAGLSFLRRWIER